ncbi:hypothetical protein [Streptomyces sp. NPDC001381]|uniref:hypothetical protein n=1 Tax=Streptomyces sp. NPDC001381 TaxID=3364567 RepID=UPI0036B97A07
MNAAAVRGYAPIATRLPVPTGDLPDRLRTLAEGNPVSALTTALRDLSGDAPAPEGAARPVARPVAGALVRCAAPIAVCAPLALRQHAHPRA